MKVYIVYLYDVFTDDNRSCLGVFSSHELAMKCGEHATKKIGYDYYRYGIIERALDGYYLQNLTPLAKALNEDL